MNDEHHHYTAASLNTLPMCLIMNIACGGPEEPDEARLPQFMTVDYARVYQLGPNAGARP